MLYFKKIIDAMPHNESVQTLARAINSYGEDDDDDDEGSISTESEETNINIINRNHIIENGKHENGNGFRVIKPMPTQNGDSKMTSKSQRNHDLPSGIVFCFQIFFVSVQALK
jgi:hypothetical protein